MQPSTDTDFEDKLLRRKSAFYLSFSIIGFAIIVCACLFLLGKVSTAVATMLFTALLVFILRKPVAFMENKGIKRSLGAILALLLCFLVLFLIGLIMSPLFGNELSEFIASVPGYINALIDWGAGVYHDYAHLIPNGDAANAALNDIVASLTGFASNFAGFIADLALGIGTSVGTACIMGLMAIVASYWLLKDLPRMGKEIGLLIEPKHRATFHDITGICAKVADGYFIGLIINSVAVGLIAGVAFFILGLPYSGILGVIFCLFNVVPYVGPWTAGAIACLVGLSISPFHAIVALIITFCAEQFVDIIIYPRVMGDAVQIHPALVMIGLIIGAVLGGLVGMILIVPLIAILKAVFVYFFEKKTGRRIVSEDGALFKMSKSELRALQGGDFFAASSDDASVSTDEPAAAASSDSAQESENA